MSNKRKRDRKKAEKAAHELLEAVGLPPAEAFARLPEGSILIHDQGVTKQGPVVGGAIHKVKRSGGRRAPSVLQGSLQHGDAIGEDGLPAGSGRPARRTPSLGGSTAPLRFLRAPVRDARAEAADLADRLERDWAEALDTLKAVVALTREAEKKMQSNEHLQAALNAEGLDTTELLRLRREAGDLLLTWTEAKLD